MVVQAWASCIQRTARRVVLNFGLMCNAHSRFQNDLPSLSAKPRSKFTFTSFLVIVGEDLETKHIFDELIATFEFLAILIFCVRTFGTVRVRKIEFVVLERIK